VRQLLEQGGMYSLEKPIGDMRYILDTRSVSTHSTSQSSSTPSHKPLLCLISKLAVHSSASQKFDYQKGTRLGEEDLLRPLECSWPADAPYANVGRKYA
jgi:hypothetical protein